MCRPLSPPRRVSRLWWVAALAPAVLLLGGTAPGQVAPREPEEYRLARQKMVRDELARDGITDDAVLQAMGKVPRHLFVSPELRARAYYDMVLPIGHKQTISPPYIVAYMTQSLDPKPTDRVLEIGTGSGYQAAVLSLIVKEVYTIEIVEPLGKQAAKRLQDLGYGNVNARVGDGYQGWPEHAPFDKIIVTCSPESVPQPLVEQLREGGKMIIPLGERYQQVFYLLEKKNGELVKKRLVPTFFVPMTGKAEEQREKMPDPVHPRLVNGGFEQLTDGQPDGWYWKREPTLEHDGAPEGKAYITITNNDPGRSSGVLQAIGVDGAKVHRFKVSLMVKAQGVQPGLQGHQQPCLAIGFGDEQSRPLAEKFLGPWVGTFGWRRVAGTFDVPRQAKVSLLRIGLNGGTGSLSVDDVQLTPVPR
jgi:protein-L-isoaspartate(D-aspartate) O-methyltransferase